MLRTLNYTKLQNFDEELVAEFAISDADCESAELLIALHDLPHSDGLAPQIRCFDDALPNLLAFMLAGGAKAIGDPVKSPDAFAARLVDLGIWQR